MTSESELFDKKIQHLEQQISELQKTSETSKGSTGTYFKYPINYKWIGIASVPIIVAILLYLTKPQMILKKEVKEKVVEWRSLFKWDIIISVILYISSYLYIYYDTKSKMKNI